MCSGSKCTAQSKGRRGKLDADNMVNKMIIMCDKRSRHLAERSDTK